MSQKASLRNLYLHKRNVLSKMDQQQFNQQILDRLLSLLKTLRFSTIHTFLPQTNKNEIDTWKIVEAIRTTFEDVKIIAPRVTPGTRHMEHYYILPHTRMVLNRWLIPEPDPASTEQADVTAIEVVLIPLLAFDEKGYRVGYGGGYYDRFLAQCEAGTLKIGVSFFDPIPRIEDIDPFDIPMDFCVTPREIFNWHFLENFSEKRP